MPVRPRPDLRLIIASTAIMLASAISFDAAESREPCGGETTAPILSNESNEVLGSAVIRHQGGALGVDLQTHSTDGWTMEKAHFYLGTTAAPKTAEGEFDLSKFHMAYDEADSRRAHRFAIELQPLLGTDYCGKPLNFVIALRANQEDDKGNPVRDASGAGTANYRICCETPTPTSDCTLTADEWESAHSHEAGPWLENDWPKIDTQSASLCGKTWLKILRTPPQKDAWLKLAHPYIAARLNSSAKSSTPAEIHEALSAARPLLETACEGIREQDIEKAAQLTTVLENYNSGLIGPGHCD